MRSSLSVLLIGGLIGFATVPASASAQVDESNDAVVTPATQPADASAGADRVAEAAVSETRGARVVVEPFRGRRTDAIRQAFVDALESHGISVVPQAEVRAQQTTLGLRRMRTPANYARLGRELGATAFFTGEVRGRRGAFSVVIRMRTGNDGNMVSTERWEAGTQDELLAVRDDGFTRFESRLGSSRRNATAGREGTAVAAQAEADANAADQDFLRAGGHNGQAEERDYFTGEVVRERETERPHFDALRIRAGIGFHLRTLGATVITPRSPEPEARGYRGGGLGHFELSLDAEFYPGALSRGPFPYLGIVFAYRRGFVPESVGCQTDLDQSGNCPNPVRIGAEQQELQAGLRFRYRFGDQPRDFEVYVDSIYDLAEFTLAVPALRMAALSSIIPPVTYHTLHLGVGGAYGIIPDDLTIVARAGYRLGLGVGAAQREIWGLSTGDIWGVSLSAELRHHAKYLATGLELSFYVEYARVNTSYRGAPRSIPGDLRNLWEPVSLQGDSTDEALRLGITVGYVL